MGAGANSVSGGERAADADERAREAERIMEIVLNSLKMRLAALTMPLNALQLKARKNVAGICTDGLMLYFNPNYVLKLYKEKALDNLRYEVAHIVFHGLLGHFEIWDAYRYKKLISAVMDIQVKRMLRFVGIAPLSEPEDEEFDEDDIGEMLEQYGFGSYYQALESKTVFRAIRKLKKHVESDDHAFWMTEDRKSQTEAAVEKNTQKKKNGREEKNAGENPNTEGINNPNAKGIKRPNAKGIKRPNGKKERIAAVWSEVREGVFGKDAANDRYEVDSEFFREHLKEWGSESGAESQMVDCRGTSKNDYEELLQRIVRMDELTKEQDNIDYAIYQYGLSLYGNVPLIEPLECIEEKKLDNLVIAIDTSGSCAGKVMDCFIRDTVKILEGLGAGMFFERIYLIQCDASIRWEACYENVWELQSAIGTSYCTYGYEGTDFRPVFERVGQLEKEGKKINALLYFSDTYGDFPEKKPDYPVHFVVPCEEGDELPAYQEDDERDHVPDWVNVVEIETGGREYV